MTLRISIEDADDEYEITVVNFKFNNLTIIVKGNGLNGKCNKLFSNQDIMFKKFARYLY
jgi:hypothetical protein